MNETASEPQFGLDDFHRLVQAVSVPVLVRDHEPLIEAYAGWAAEDFVAYLRLNDTNLRTALDALGPRVASDAWYRLYGGDDPEEDTAEEAISDNREIPDTVEPMIQGGSHAEMHEHLIAQLSAPFYGVKSLTFEHSVPGFHGSDIIVRSFWKAAGGPDRPYSRVVTVDLDVTDVRRTERAAQEIADSRARIIRTVGHELRNPLAGIVGIAQVVYDEWDSLDNESRRSLMKTVADQAQDVTMILADLMAGAGAEQSDLGVEIRPVDMTEILTRADLSDFEVRLEQLKPAMADPLRTRQIIRNLAQNARKYGGPEKSIRSFVSGDRIVIQVSDNGEGIHGSNLENLFEPFNSSRTEGSTGLGLSISKGLAIAMNGDLMLRQDLPGTTFELTLPISRMTAGVGTAA